MTRTLIAALLALTSTAVAETSSSALDMNRPDYSATPVINGTAVPTGKWPDAVAVLSAQGSCTGTLIAPDVVLTAGHCADPAPTTVIANTTNYNGTGGVRATVKSVTAYPNWENTYDIAIIVLNAPMVGVTPRRVGAACTFQTFADNMMVHLVGFGLTDSSGQGDNTTLREASAPIIDADCSSSGKGCSAGALPAGEFIAGGSGTDSCYGDSGGPVYLDTPRGTVVVGAVSRGLDNSATPCGGGGIYVRTDKVLQWIEATAGKPVMKDSCAGDVTNPEDENGGGSGSGGGSGEEYVASEITGGCSTGTGGTGGAAVVLALLLGGLRRRRR
ncbi:MAG: serine protease [Deltaproteobacteria bacterium]|nr:serine protease [Deltaproteobacteria bacterium]